MQGKKSPFFTIQDFATFFSFRATPGEYIVFDASMMACGKFGFFNGDVIKTPQGDAVGTSVLNVWVLKT